MNQSSQNLNLQPTLQDRAGFHVIGCAEDFLPGATQAIGQLWGRFVARIDEIPGRVGMATYGVCRTLPGSAAESERFTYIAGVEVETLEAIPDGMTGVDMPACTYAVFAYNGGLGEELPKTMQYIFGDWLPNSDFEISGDDFEYYDDRFNPVTGKGTFYIYLPVKPKSQ